MSNNPYLPPEPESDAPTGNSTQSKSAVATVLKSIKTLSDYAFAAASAWVIALFMGLGLLMVYGSADPNPPAMISVAYTIGFWASPLIGLAVCWYWRRR